VATNCAAAADEAKQVAKACPKNADGLPAGQQVDISEDREKGENICDVIGFRLCVTPCLRF
jgi:hypothetical protein